MNEKDTYISYFTPSEMTAETLEFIFVKREKLAARLVNHVRESVLSGAKYQNLLVGPRGVGKSHMVALVYHRIKNLPELKGKIAVAWLAEEEWMVGSLVDFYVVVLEALEREYGDLRSRIDALYQLPNAERTHAAADLIRAFVGNRTLFLLMENLEEMFSGLHSDELWSLRSFLSKTPFATILATTPSLFDAVDKQKEAFFGFFQPAYLPGLSVKEATNLLEKLAERRGDTGLTNFLKTDTAQDRVQAVHELAGGHPRIYLLFAHLLTQSNMESLVTPFMEFLDELTPYFQDRMKGLATQPRKIITFLCDQRGAVTVSDIVARTNGMTSQTVSSQLNRLEQMGYVSKTRVGRESFYELREPLLRMIVEKKRGRGEPIRLVVDFLRRWYSRDERRDRMGQSHGMTAAYWKAALDLDRAVQDTPDPSRAEKLSPEFWKAQENKDYARAAEIAAEIIERKGRFCEADDWSWYAWCLHKKRDFAEAIKGYNKSIELNPNDATIWNDLGDAFKETLYYEEALKCVEKSISLDPNDAVAWTNKGNILHWLLRYDEALECLDKSVVIAPLNLNTWIGHGTVLKLLDRNVEALESWDKACAIEPQNDEVWVGRGGVLASLGRYSEAVENFDKAFIINPSHAFAWGSRGCALYRLSQFDEALSSFEKSIKFDPKESVPQFCSGRIYLWRNQWDKFQKSLEDGLAISSPEDIKFEDTTAYCKIFLQNRQPDEPQKIAWLINLYAKHNAVGKLGQGLIASIPLLVGPEITQARADEWCELWNRVGAKQPDLEVPLRLLTAATVWKPKRDVRALLALAIEERRVLEQILQTDAAPSAAPS